MTESLNLSLPSELLLRQITDRQPELTDFGFGVFHNRTGQPLRGAERAAEMAENRAAMFLPRSVEQFDRSRLWLRHWPRIGQVNMKVGTSYGLKHGAEPFIGYVTNGIFIAAAYAEGFTVQRDGGASPNARFNISSKVVSFRYYEARVKALREVFETLMARIPEAA